MMCIYFLVLLVILLKESVSFSDSDSVAENEFRHCVCVPYWQCKEDFSGLVEDGTGIIDVRFVNNNACTDVDVCCKIECGKRRGLLSYLVDNNVSSYREILNARILGDNNQAEFGEFPWMLGVLQDKVYRCGASLIHPQIALTAAHCVGQQKNIIVRAGEWNWEETTEPFPHQNRLVTKVIVHPYYHPASLRNDIALLILDTPFHLTQNVGLTCLPKQNSKFDRKRCIATGWGKNSHNNGRYQSILKKVELPMVPKQKCLKTLQDATLGPFFSLHNSFICAGGEANKDTCKGDGGGPLICPIDDQPGRYEQVGIVSWGLKSRFQDVPGVYVNLGLFRNWIDTTLKLLDFSTDLYDY